MFVTLLSLLGKMEGVEYQDDVAGEEVVGDDVPDVRQGKKQKGSNVSFLGHDKRVMEQFPTWVQLNLPFIATHKGALSR
jgi:hypothetical protein